MKARLLAVVAVLAAIAAGAAAASTSVTITSPGSGSKVSLKRTPYLAIAGTAAFADASAGTTRFFLRRDGCGTSNDNPHLSVTSGTDAGDGCGLIVNGAAGAGGDADQAAFVDFPASDGMPLALDGTKAIDGQIALTGAQVGVAYVDVTLSALVGGKPVTIGSTTASAVLDPTGNDTPVPFTIQPSVSLDGSDVQALDLRVHIHGPNIYSGFMSLNGASYVNVPSYAASANKTVSVSVDDPTFANAVPARLDGTSWSVAVATPAVGKHTIYARSTQGYDTSATASSTFTVTK
ncbi:MAG TPA: hypothetical protein VGG88_03910 [Gaiellaceae bacterium]